MNSLMTENYPILEMYQPLRNQLMDILSDDDLPYQPSAHNHPLGVLCREIGETEMVYIQSFKTFQMNFDYHNDAPRLASSVAALQAWYAELDAELKTTLEALSEEDLQKTIDRGGGFLIPPKLQVIVYQEALLIFYGKVSVYLKAMGKGMPQRWHEWIG